MRDGCPSHHEERPDGGTVSIDDVLRVLADPRSRAICYYLQEHEVATVEELAEHIAAQEVNQRGQVEERTQVERIKLDLLHNTLPKIRDSHFIEYDARSQTVRYSQPPELLEAVLRFLARIDQVSY